MSELEKLRFQLDAWSSGGSEPDEGRLDVLEAPLQVIQILGVCSRWKLIEILLLSVADHFKGPGRRELRHKICASRKFSGMTAKHLQIFPCERVLLAGGFDALEQLVGREQSECAQQLGFLHLGFASIMLSFFQSTSLL